MYKFGPQQPLDTSSAKLLHEIQLGGDDMQQLCSELQQQSRLRNMDLCFNGADFSGFPQTLAFPCVVSLKFFGIYWDEAEFVKAAMQAKHPLDVALGSP